MEYVEGRSLSRVVDQGPLEFRTAVEYIRQAADGLAHAHEASIVHQDIKPDNLLLSPTGSVKVLELGVALLGDQNAAGRASFAAPEQLAEDGASDARTDVHGLGASLYYLLSGRPPFEGQRGDRPLPLTELRPDVPAELAGLCHWMLAANPNDRPRSASKVSRLLAKWLSGKPIEVPAAPVAVSEPEPVAEPVAPPPVVTDAEPTLPVERPAAPGAAKMLLLSVLLVALVSLAAWAVVAM